ncbi:MAG TPA: hypothetical protein VH437_16050 [Terriglobales bacterium]|jgi:cytoskeletal protein RodZ
MSERPSRFLGVLLALVLSGVAEPVSMYAQQASPLEQATPQAGSTASPEQAPAAEPPASTASPQQPSSVPTQGSTEQRQEQEDKASQDLLNGNRETGTQLPESPDTTRARQEAAEKASQQQEPTSEPTGTAAAPAGTVSGSTASRPAGAAIAPAKQRQVRSFVIKLGLIAGAGVALGTVYALSRGSSSTPPGAR